MVHALHEPVSALMREAAETIIMPRYRTLDAGEIDEKTPGDLVTVADREAELFLAPRLAALVEGSRVIGEEAVSADASLVESVERGTLWLVDPVDGTNNFAAGTPPFAVMVALVGDGVIEAGWILDPVSGRMCHAARGAGAFVDGERITARGVGGPGIAGGFSTRFVPPDLRARIDARFKSPDRIMPGLKCAGADYPHAVLGGQDFILFWKSMPWDHAPGALFVEEAGGKVAKPDGGPYRLGDMSPGILAAASPALWEKAAKMLFGTD